MDITTEATVTRLSDEDSRLTIHVKVDGHPTGQLVALSGPTVDVNAYVAGDISFEEVERRWRMRR